MKALMTDDCAVGFSLKGAKKRYFIDTNMFDVVFGKELHFFLVRQFHIDSLRNVMCINSHNIFPKEAACSGNLERILPGLTFFPF